MAATHVVEEDLLRSIEEVEARILVFRQKVRAVLATAQSEVEKASGRGESQART